MIRVIPRDLFNDANLLKCYGRLQLFLMDHPAFAGCTFGLEEDALESQFDIHQTTDGETFVANLQLTVHGVPVTLYRPLNAKGNWPLWFSIDCLDTLQEFETSPLEYLVGGCVFHEDGNIDEDFITMVNQLKERAQNAESHD